MTPCLAIAIASALFLLPDAAAQGLDPKPGQYFWINPAGRDALARGIYASPDTGAFQPFEKGSLSTRSRMEVTEVQDRWARVRFHDGADGWVVKVLFENSNLILRENPHLTEQRRQAAEKAKEQAAKREAEERRRRVEVDRLAFIGAQPWPRNIKDLIVARKIEKGMQPEMVKLSIGQPMRILETDIGSLRKEQWIYPGGTILFFENDRLIGWQREK